LRQSIITQVIGENLKQNIRNPAQRQIVASIAAATVDPTLADLVSPEALTDFLGSGWPSALPDRPAGIPAGISVVNSANLGFAWRTYMNADFGIRRLETEVPEFLPHNRRFGLEFRLINWRWRLVRIKLPEDVRLHLAELVASRRRGKRLP
jgi:hypothetical protein